MKLATLLVLSLVILGAFGNPQRGGGGRRGGGGPRGRGKRKLLEKCGVDRDFCDDGQRPDVLPFPENARDCSSWVDQEFDKENKPDRPDREDCTVGERVIFLRLLSSTIYFCVQLIFALTLTSTT